MSNDRDDVSKTELAVILLRTHEHFGDFVEQLEVPETWTVDVRTMAGHESAVLAPNQIREELRSPIAASSLHELARGKRSAVITFDDLTRPTPLAAIAPLVVEELVEAGLPKDRILFLCACGTHRPLEQDEVVRKLGLRLLREHAWLNHNPWDNLQDVGTTSGGNRILVNRTFASSDLRITLSGVKYHGFAGYGGGAKAVLPGVAGVETVVYNHTTLRSRAPAPREGEIQLFRSTARADMEEAAKLARVDFSVQVVYNGDRRVNALFAGDIVEAHRHASHYAVRHYRTDAAVGPDVVVVNSYPQATQAGAHRWTTSVVEGGTVILVVQHPQGIGAMHYFAERVEGLRNGSYLDAVGKRRQALPGGRRLVVYSQYTDKRQRDRLPEDTVFVDDWKRAVEAVTLRHGRCPRVAVYPYAPLQHLESRLDDPR